MSIVNDIADAIVAKLNADFRGPWAQAVRTYQPSYKLEELATCRCTVIPRAVKITNASRTSQNWDCSFDIGVQQKISTDVNCDDLMIVVEQIVKAFTRVDLGNAVFIEIANDPAFIPEKLDEQRVFMSVVTVTYRVRA